MAVLADADRAEVQAEYMRRSSDDRLPIAITKAQLQAAVNAVDTWVNDNTAAFNSALPAAARNNLTASQKALLLVYVVLKRHVRGV